ncbi:hypothetical protein LguiA_006118 [Lonicera macranthoides]
MVVICQRKICLGIALTELNSLEVVSSGRFLSSAESTEPYPFLSHRVPYLSHPFPQSLLPHSLILLLTHPAPLYLLSTTTRALNSVQCGQGYLGERKDDLMLMALQNITCTR